MKPFQKLFSVLFYLCLFAFTAYALLDTFVITRVYETVEQSTPAREVSTASESGAHTLSARQTDESGEGSGGADQSSAAATGTEEAQIEITQYRVDNTTVYVADIQLTSASQLKTAFSRNSYGRNVTADTSDTAALTGATLAINGDNYGSREKGYVIRNGTLYRDTAAKDQEDLVIYADGSFGIINESGITAQELLENGAVQVFSFGPGLVEDGEIMVDAADEVDRAKASNPRTAVGIIEAGHYVFVVADGRTDESEGLSLYELAVFMQSLGVQTAYNMDGGGSSTMVYQGTVVNKPTSGRSIGERAVTDIIYI